MIEAEGTITGRTLADLAGIETIGEIFDADGFAEGLLDEEGGVLEDEDEDTEEFDQLEDTEDENIG